MKEKSTGKAVSGSKKKIERERNKCKRESRRKGERRRKI